MRKIILRSIIILFIVALAVWVDVTATLRIANHIQAGVDRIAEALGRPRVPEARAAE